MQEIGVYLNNNNNTFVQSFRNMANICNQQEANEVFMSMITYQNTDQRRFNQAITQDVADVFRAGDGIPPGERNLVIYSKSHGIRRVSVLDPNLDPMAYPLLFP